MHLQRRAFDLLRYLVERPNVVVSKEELLERVWAGVAVTEASLARAIMSIRVALEDDADAPTFVQTTRGRGYRLAKPVRIVAPHESAASSPPSSSGSLLVGRASQLAAARKCLDRAIQGRGGILLVTGDPGLGKTHMLEWLERLCSETAGVRVAMVRCNSAGGAPDLWPIERVLGFLEGRASQADDLDARDSYSNGPRAELGDPAKRYVLFERIADTLVAAAQAGPLVLIFDDLQLADVHSLGVVERLASRLRGVRLLIACAYRTGVTDPKLRATIGLLARESSATAIALEPLTRGEVSDYLARVLGTELSSRVRDKVFEKTSGNPLLINQLVRVLCNETRERPAEIETSALVGGQTMREAVVHHLASLPESVTRLLTVASVFGRSFSLAPLAAALATSNARALRDLDAAEAARVVARSGPGVYRFTYPLVQDALYRQLSISERAQLHAKAALALESRFGPGEGHLAAAEVARHFVEASSIGDFEKAVAWCLRAVSLAEAAGDRLAAAQCAERGLNALRFAPEPVEEVRDRLLAVRGRAAG